MFDNISEKLKIIANVLFKIAFVLAIIMGIAGLAFLGDSGGAAVAMIIGAAGVLGGAYVSSALIYGFSELIEKTMSTNQHIANISSNALPKVLKTLDEQSKDQNQNEQ